MVRMKRRSISKKESSGLQNLSQCLTKNVLFLKARAIRCCQMLSDVVKCCRQMLLSDVVVKWCRHILSDVVKCCCQMLLSNVVVEWCRQMFLSNVVVRCCSLSDVVREDVRCWS